MKKKLFYIVLVLCPVVVFGQKIAYIHADSVLQAMPQYRIQEAKLDSVRVAYSKEVDAGTADVQKRYETLVTPYTPKSDETLPVLKQRMSASDTLRLALLQKDATQWQEKRAAYEKMLQTQYTIDVQPLLDKVNGLVADYAKANGLSAVYGFEQLRNLLVYIDPKLNITGIIIRKLKQK